MHATIGRTVLLPLKAHFADWTVLGDERRHVIQRALAMRNQVEHRILGLTEMARAILRIGDEKATGTANGRLLVADRALVAIKPGAEAGGIGQCGQVRIFTGVGASTTSLPVSQTDSSCGTIAGVAKRMGVHRRMVCEAIGSALPKPRKKTERPRWKLRAAVDFVGGSGDADRKAPRERRHTAHRIWQRIQAIPTFPQPRPLTHI